MRKEWIGPQTDANPGPPTSPEGYRGHFADLEVGAGSSVAQTWENVGKGEPKSWRIVGKSRSERLLRETGRVLGHTPTRDHWQRSRPSRCNAEWSAGATGLVVGSVVASRVLGLLPCAAMETVIDSADVRVADADRSMTQRLLGEHLTAGRLNAEEYGERATEAASARTRSEITTLFRDLPQPWPQFDVPAPSVTDDARPNHPARTSVARNTAVTGLGAYRHGRYAAIAIVATCALSGAVLGAQWIAHHPTGLLLAGPLVAILYGLQVLVGKSNHTRQ